MNREIKFRAWDTENKLSDGRFIMWYQDDQCITIGDCYRIGTRDGNSLMQFTGLKDKNGKEIYEGDMVKHGYGFGKGIGIVEYLAPEYVLSDNKDGICSELLGRTEVSIEIIGNIHENPKLVKP
jgi:uncharacterized phage protein (TIGR01671 family)